MKVVINNCFGGFSLSPKAAIEYYKRKGITVFLFEQEGYGDNATYKRHFDFPDNCWIDYLFDVENPNALDHKELWENHFYSTCPEDRSDSDLVAVVEQFGKEANGSCASLKVVEIPDDVSWEIEEYDGNEHIAEHHRTWG